MKTQLGRRAGVDKQPAGVSNGESGGKEEATDLIKVMDGAISWLS